MPLPTPLAHRMIGLGLGFPVFFGISTLVAYLQPTPSLWLFLLLPAMALPRLLWRWFMPARCATCGGKVWARGLPSQYRCDQCENRPHAA